MTEIKVKDKEVAVPGQVLAEGLEYLPSYGTYREGDKILASRLGVINVDGKVLRLTPLSGRYNPKKRDTVVGKVVEILFSGWRIEINCAYQGVLSIQQASSEYIEKGANLKKFYDIGDYVVTSITNVTTQKLVDLTMKGPGLRKLRGGRVISVNTYKVPRIIGKAGSMVSMIKQATGCRITVGQNGWVWVQNDDPSKEVLAVEVIKKIEAEAHIPGLTSKIKSYLEEKTGVKIDENSNQSSRNEEKNDNDGDE